MESSSTMTLSAPSPLRILLADADRAAMQIIATALRRRGHQVSVTDQLGDVVQGDAELMVCERSIFLQALPGWRAQGLSPEVILIADQPSSDDCRQATSMGAREVLAKPFRLADLVRAIETTVAPLPRQSSSGVLERNYRAFAGASTQAARDVMALALRSGTGPAARARIGSAVAEIVENACTHAYPTGEGTIQLLARFERADLLVTIRDAGCGFDAAGLDAHELHDTSAYGIARARALSEELGIESTPGVGTRVEMIFRTSQVAFDDGSVVDLSDHDFFPPELAERVLKAVTLDPHNQIFELPPALAVVVGRLLSSNVSTRKTGKDAWS